MKAYLKKTVFTFALYNKALFLNNATDIWSDQCLVLAMAIMIMLYWDTKMWDLFALDSV